jgi:hypothetical protein
MELMGMSTKFVVVNMTDRLSCASVPKVADALLAGETIEIDGATLGVSEPPQPTAKSAPPAMASKLFVSFLIERLLLLSECYLVAG